MVIHMPKINNVYFLSIIATVGGMLFGFDISSVRILPFPFPTPEQLKLSDGTNKQMSAIIGTSQYVAYFNNPQGIVQGGIGAALAGGSVIGALIAGPVSNKFGRRDCEYLDLWRERWMKKFADAVIAIFFACFWWLLGTALQTASELFFAKKLEERY